MTARDALLALVVLAAVAAPLITALPAIALLAFGVIAIALMLRYGDGSQP